MHGVRMQEERRQDRDARGENATGETQMNGAGYQWEARKREKSTAKDASGRCKRKAC